MQLIALLSLFSVQASAIWPIPLYLKTGNTVIWISEDVQFNWPGVGAGKAGSSFLEQWNPFSSYYQRRDTEGGSNGVTGDDIILFAIDQTRNTIFKESFVPWKFHPREWQEPGQSRSSQIRSVDIKLLAQDPEDVAKSLAGTVDESYSLVVTEDGGVEIAANSSIGIRHGLNTFTQLFYQHTQGGSYTPLAPIEIYDAPKFLHRGINMDVARQWFSAADIERQIDAAAYNKMNRFHLHVTDSQSWPLHIPSLPELAPKGAYRPDLVYSVEDFRSIQRRAALQGVQLVTEIDMPGHTSSIHHSYPDLIAAFNIQPWTSWAAEPPSGTLKLNSTAVYDFLETLFNDLLPRVYPYTSYFHTGGDEVNRLAYTIDETVESSSDTVLRPLMQRFVDRNHDQVRKLGLTPIVWEEMLSDWNLTLGADVIVQSWRSDDAVLKIVESGHKALVGNYKRWYLDCGKGTWIDYPSSSANSHYPFYDYCAPFHNWRMVYDYDPLANIPDDKHDLVIGGEAHMWAEQTDPINIDASIWPRGSAVAEVLWSGSKDENGNNRSQTDVSPRLSEMRERLVARGVRAEPIQMPYCTMDREQCMIS